MEKTLTLAPAASRALRTWLAVICFMVVSIVVVGGITRLTRSGLSIVEWKLISGVLPPLTQSAWEVEFAKYQKFPEYQLINHGMTLSEFKFIYFWEYLHRLLGRMIGLAFLVPGLVFWRKGWINRRLGFQLMIGFMLGGLQGALGWYMVKSGLVQNPSVSHYRLAAHLLLAFGVVSYLLWILLSIGETQGSVQQALPRTISKGNVAIRRALVAVTGVLVLQILYGAFTAGLHAGFGFNTFPMMNDEWFPSGFFRADVIPTWLNALENPIAVQFIHRWMGTVLVAAILVLGWSAREADLQPRQKSAILHLVIAAVAQFALGVATLLMVVPVSVATFHQLGACILLLVSVRALHTLRAPIA